MSPAALALHSAMPGLLMFALAGVVGTAHADSLFHSGPARVPMLELFTSEGCSSCPPADAWLTQQLDNPKLWQSVVPIAWHVDYWNALGWPDRFSQAAYSRRQREYEASGHLSQVYTPGLVYAGQEWRGYFKQADVPPLTDASAGELTLQLHDRQLQVTFAAPAVSTQSIAHVALLGFGLESAIARGENTGKHLRHDFVVLAHQTLSPKSPIRQDEAGFASLGPESENEKLTRTSSAPASTSQAMAFRVWQGTLPATAQTAKRYALVSWISVGRDPTPLQSTGGYLR
ncbi:DUF1223 domain-containing protein [Permianibacter sp. IMCC34836]|uniref:DUF1223 domain-containing protein n=1 Tax=Permianibacter fluminis TaxID=2738515 RepID=UPI001553A72C|nr:DUF1223 domain-containing protein [Permianibacter fluminis]NQD37163.1 DUF1223 domain-containing protein [Permianibacter fluminis]